jgi:hypothetical protein
MPARALSVPTVLDLLLWRAWLCLVCSGLNYSCAMDMDWAFFLFMIVLCSWAYSDHGNDRVLVMREDAKDMGGGPYTPVMGVDGV